MNFGRQSFSLATVTILCALLGASAANAFESFRDVETTASVRSGKAIPQQAEEEDDDDETFFSSGAKPSRITSSVQIAPQVARKAAAMVDAGEVCREVLSDDASLYNRKFISGCKKMLTQQPTRRAAR